MAQWYYIASKILFYMVYVMTCFIFDAKPLSKGWLLTIMYLSVNQNEFWIKQNIFLKECNWNCHPKFQGVYLCSPCWCSIYTLAIYWHIESWTKLLILVNNIWYQLAHRKQTHTLINVDQDPLVMMNYMSQFILYKSVFNLNICTPTSIPFTVST